MKTTDLKTEDKVARPVEKLLAFADFLETLPREQFSMNDWGHERCDTPACICGWWNRQNGRQENCWIDAAREMGLPLSNFVLNGRNTGVFETPTLFEPGSVISVENYCHPMSGLSTKNYRTARRVTPQEAAKVVRHFALTGEQDWTILA
jgi:hypothetical protein